MLPQTDAFHQSSNQSLLVIKELRIGRLLRQANIRKACGNILPLLVGKDREEQSACPHYFRQKPEQEE